MGFVLYTINVECMSDASNIQGRIQEFQKKKEARYRRGIEFLRSDYCFDIPLHIPYLFVVRIKYML